MIIQIRIIYFFFFKHKNLELGKNKGDEPSLYI